MSTVSSAAIAWVARVQFLEVARFVVVFVLNFNCPGRLRSHRSNCLAFRRDLVDANRGRIAQQLSESSLAWAELVADLSYKLARVRLLKPQVIVLGHSRGLWVPSDLMKPYSFYDFRADHVDFRSLPSLTGADHHPWLRCSSSTSITLYSVMRMPTAGATISLPPFQRIGRISRGLWTHCLRHLRLCYSCFVVLP